MSNTEINTPFFVEEVFQNLPALLKEACSKYLTKRERDIFLLSFLTNFGTFFPNVRGEYRGAYKYPYLYSFIIGPPSTGKSAMIHALKAVRKIDMIFAESLHLPKKYGDSIFTGGDVSTSAFMEKFDACNGVGIFFESESDTIADTLKKEWGGYSDKWRKAAEHEEVKMLRISKEKEISIECPKLSICISGTPDQVASILPSAANGLFSRFGFYIYYENSDFDSPFSADANGVQGEYLDSMQVKIVEIYNHFADKNVEFKLSIEQKSKFTAYMKEWELYIRTTMGSRFESVVKRYAVAFFRIIQILSIVRCVEDGEEIDETLYCKDEDYLVGRLMIMTLFLHAREASKLLPNDVGMVLPTELLELYKLLPQEREITSREMNVFWSGRFSPRTADARRAKLEEAGYLTKIKNGLYHVNKQA